MKLTHLLTFMSIVCINNLLTLHSSAMINNAEEKKINEKSSLSKKNLSKELDDLVKELDDLVNQKNKLLGKQQTSFILLNKSYNAQANAKLILAIDSQLEQVFKQFSTLVTGVDQAKPSNPLTKELLNHYYNVIKEMHTLNLSQIRNECTNLSNLLNSLYTFITKSRIYSLIQEMQESIHIYDTIPDAIKERISLLIDISLKFTHQLMPIINEVKPQAIELNSIKQEIISQIQKVTLDNLKTNPLQGIVAMSVDNLIFEEAPSKEKFCCTCSDHKPFETNVKLNLPSNQTQPSDLNPKKNGSKAIRKPNSGNDANFKGYCYALGREGLDQNFDKAYKWFEKGANDGHKVAMYNLAGCFYLTSKIFATQNAKNHFLDQALKYLKQSAEKGFKPAVQFFEERERIFAKKKEMLAKKFHNNMTWKNFNALEFYETFKLNKK
jgi:hypothetical protein